MGIDDLVSGLETAFPLLQDDDFLSADDLAHDTVGNRADGYYRFLKGSDNDYRNR